MTFSVPIATTIDYIIQRIGRAKVCEDHLKLVATSLNRLQRGLNEMDVGRNDSRSHEDIIQTLKAIDEVVISCSENEANLRGITYQDLESLLLRFHTRIAQLEANLINDYEAKVQILTNAHHEQQIFVQKVFDEKMRQRLEAIEQHTKKNTIEQLRVLRQKHESTILSYLRCCIELHKSVPLTGLTGSIVSKIAHSFYQISFQDQTQLERDWQSCELPLTRTFVQFKPDKSTSFERNESRRLLIGPEANLLEDPHSRTEASNSIWQRLVSAPYMMSMVERDRFVEEENVSEESIIRTKRWAVILGDPGSGKTSFGRWLVHHLAQRLLLNGQHSTEYGPLRIPILIRIGEFAESLKEQSSLTLFEYIGKHKWMGKAIVDNSSVSLRNLSGALQDYIKQGQALIILDGLDEIPVSDLRSKIINVVENFVETYAQTPTGASALDNAYLSRLFDDPSQSGGNQVIVTSRIVGYHAAPLAGQFAHYTIQPMNMEYVKDFVDYWFFRVHQHILDTLGLTVLNQGEKHGEALKEELKKPENVGLRDVASNPCLMSFICSVAFSQAEGSPLPSQRILLYEQIVNSMLSLWGNKRSTISIPNLIRILSDIATHIHEHSASGLIHEEKMKDVCIQSIRTSLNKKILTEVDVLALENQASDFVQIIREDVGILAARGESLYGFLHLTFQEYFTCLKLIDVNKLKRDNFAAYRSNRDNNVQLVAQSLRHHTNDPRFRVPIALALGKISITWSRKDYDDFCLEFIHEMDDSDALLPLGAYMLISCSNDLVHYPSDGILFDTLDRLIIAAGQHRWSIVCPFLIDQITTALKKLRNDKVPIWINHLLSRLPPHDIRTISALCHLLEGKPHEFENIKWLDQSLCLMFQSLSILDNENNEFAIDRLLVKIAFSNHRLLPANPTTLKGFLLTNEIELNSIPTSLFPLIVALYGGLKRDGQTVIFDPFYIHRESTAVTPILIRFLSTNDRNKPDPTVRKVKQECVKSFLARIENHDESYETVDLCIATICLYGIDYVQDNLKIISKSLFRLSINRLKYISMILRQFYFTDDENDHSLENETTKFISTMIDKFQHSESGRVQFLDLLNLLRSGLARLRSSPTSILLEGTSASETRVTLNLPNSLRKENNFLNGLLSADIRFDAIHKSCSLIHHFTKLFWILEHNSEFDTQYRMAVKMDSIPEYLLFHNDEDILCSLTFVPQHLRNLYLRILKQKFIIINSNDSTANDGKYLYFGHILIECLMLLSNISFKRLFVISALITLVPMLRMHQLENFGSSLLWALVTKYSDYLAMFETARQRPMDNETGLYINRIETLPGENDMTDDERRTVIKECINQEHQRLRDALNENGERSMKLYSACVSLACVCPWTQDERRLFLFEESMQGAMSINNKLARLDALCVIAYYSHSDYDRIQVGNGRSLQTEIEYQLNDIYSTLPLLLHTALFIRCLPLLRHRSIMDRCLENLFDKLVDSDQRDQQAVTEALLPYVHLHSDFSSIAKPSLPDNSTIVHYKSSVVKKHFNNGTNDTLSLSMLLSSLYLTELTSEFQECMKSDVHQLHSNSFIIDESLATKLFQFESSILTAAQVLTITSILSSISSLDQSEHSEKLCLTLSNALHHFSVIEFKACHLLEYWMKWIDSNKLSSFAYHAALLLIDSDLWSTEATTIICDLLCCQNDRFRQRAEMIFRSRNGDDVRTSSKLGIDVLLVLAKKKAHYQHTNASAKLTLGRMLGSITLDIQSHLETFLWLERYRIHALVNTNYVLKESRAWTNSHVASYFSSDTTMNACFCANLFRTSGDLIIYMCDLIASNLFSFLDIDGDSTSDTVLNSHTQFVVSVLVTLDTQLNHTNETRQLGADALMNLFDTCENDEIRRASVYALSYVCNTNTYKILFDKIQVAVNDEASHYSDYVIAALISSYCYSASINRIDFDQDDIELFFRLIEHPSQDVLKAVYVGLGRVLKDRTLLFELFGLDYIRCYRGLIGSTAYLFFHDVSQNSENSTAEFIEQHPDLFSIFITEVYSSIRHFTKNVLPVGRADFYLTYGNPQYVGTASLVAIRMPAAFCAYIRDWCDGKNFKRALFYTSKQHNFPQRAACLTILSIFGELTVELCEMFMEALRDDPHVQNTCFKCLARINSVKDETVVLNLLVSYLKSKSMNVRYLAAKMLLHLSKSSLLPSNQIQTALKGLMLDADSNEDLWLIEEQDNVVAECVYHYAGPLKDVIYCLLVQHLTGDASEIIRRNELNNIDLNFFESEKASRLASCLYEPKTDGNVA